MTSCIIHCVIHTSCGLSDDVCMLQWTPAAICMKLVVLCKQLGLLQGDIMSSSLSMHQWFLWIFLLRLVLTCLLFPVGHQAMPHLQSPTC